MVALLCTTAALFFASSAAAHSNGRWEFAWQVDQQMTAHGFTKSHNCSGWGAYRYPPNAVPNQGKFLYRHFVCNFEITWSTWGVACIHTLSNGSITGTRWYLPHTCRF